MATDYKERHRAAVARPESPEEQTLVTLMGELESLAKRYPEDYVMIPAIEHLASAIIILLNADTGRLDQGMTDAAVRKIVERAGGDHNEV